MTGRPSFEAQDRESIRNAARMSEQAVREHVTAALAGAPPLVLDDELARLISGILGEPAVRQRPTPVSPFSQQAAAAAAFDAATAGVQQQQGEQAVPAAPTAADTPLPGPPHRIPTALRAAFPQPPPCAFLRPGQSFEGRQRVSHHGNNPKHEHWEVHAQIQHYDTVSGYVAGTMEAANVPDTPAPVTTFFEGEIIDNVNHTFYTADWDACADTDFQHWSKFPPFRSLHAEVVRHGGRCPSLATHPYIYMRWKEQFFLQGSECRLTIAGFYYLAIHRVTGSVLGFYYDPSSTPDQKLDLTAVRAGPAGFAFPHYELA